MSRKLKTKTTEEILEESKQLFLPEVQKGLPLTVKEQLNKTWVSVDALRQWLEDNAKIECFQCEKCGFIDASTHEEFKAMPKEHQQFLLEHRQKCGGRFLPYKIVALKELLDLLEGVEK